VQVGAAERPAGDSEVVLFVVTAGGALRVATGDGPPATRAGDTTIALSGGT
jgi:hypothetical protein